MNTRDAEKNRTYQRELYQYRKSLGICPIAGCPNNPVQGKALCATHSQQKRYQKRREKVAA